LQHLNIGEWIKNTLIFEIIFWKKVLSPTKYCRALHQLKSILLWNYDRGARSPESKLHGALCANIAILAALITGEVKRSIIFFDT
jgi:hypothetical protein